MRRSAAVAWKAMAQLWLLESSTQTAQQSGCEVRRRMAQRKPASCGRAAEAAVAESARLPS